MNLFISRSSYDYMCIRYHILIGFVHNSCCWAFNDQYTISINFLYLHVQPSDTGHLVSKQSEVVPTTPSQKEGQYEVSALHAQHV